MYVALTILYVIQIYMYIIGRCICDNWVGWGFRIPFPSAAVIRSVVFRGIRMLGKEGDDPSCTPNFLVRCLAMTLPRQAGTWQSFGDEGRERRQSPLSILILMRPVRFPMILTVVMFGITPTDTRWAPSIYQWSYGTPQKIANNQRVESAYL